MTGRKLQRILAITMLMIMASFIFSPFIQVGFAAEPSTDFQSWLEKWFPSGKTDVNPQINVGGNNSTGQNENWLSRQGDKEDMWWKVTKFISKDIILDRVKVFDGFTDPNFQVKVSDLYKWPRGLLGGFFADQSPVKLAADAWDGYDKYNEAKTFAQNVKRVKELQAAADGVDLAQEAAEELDQLKNVSRLAKGVAIAGVVISGVDMGVNIYKAATSDNGYDVADNTVKAIGSLGEGLMAGAVLAGPTPLGAGLAIAGAALWIGSAAYSAIGGSRTIVKGWNAAKSAVSEGWNTVKGWFS